MKKDADNKTYMVEKKSVKGMLYVVSIGSNQSFIYTIGRGIFVKKFLLLSLSLMVVALFCGAAFAQVGHVGHVDKDGVEVVDDFAAVTVVSTDITGGVLSGDVTQLTTGEMDDFVNSLKAGELAFVGLPGDDDYKTTIYNAIQIDITGYVKNVDLVLDFSGVPGTWTGVFIEKKPEGSNNVQYFAKDDNGKVTISNPGAFFTENEVLFVKLEKASTPTTGGGGGGGGCSLGMLSPFALLLAVPLVLLKK